MQENWKELTKCSCNSHQSLKLTSNLNCRFSQIAFDSLNESLIAIDSKGQAYILDLIRSNFCYKKIGYVGQCNFVQFNPINNGDILIGLNTNDVKVTQVADTTCYCILSGHTLPPKRATFYKEFCMTVSNNEAIIWCLETYSKAHQLISNDLSIKTAAFSNSGLVIILYKSNVIKCWLFRQFAESVTLNLNDFDLQNVKDFNFSKDGKMMIVGSSRQIVVFDTENWTVMKKANCNYNDFIINKLVVIEKPFNFIIANLLSNCSLTFFDLSMSNLVNHCECRAMKLIKRMEVSKNGEYLAHVKTDGELIISTIDKLLMKKINSLKDKEHKIYAHPAEDHLYYMQIAIKEELKLERLLPILKEFGEYPDRHRALIWSTIMNLPTNTDAYISLTKNITDTINQDPIKSYSLADKSKATLLGTIVKCLERWCCLFEHSDFIAELVFPFVIVFKKNPILAFESSLTIIINFCQKWFEYHPLPPLNILGIVENILLDADPQLLSFFCDCGITSTDYAWPLLRTTFSEVLSANEWLILWDHLLSYSKPSLLLCCTVAFNLCCRQAIIANMKTPEDIQQLYSSQSHIPAKKIFKVAQKLDKLMPPRIHPNTCIRDKLVPIPVGDIYPPLSQIEYPKILAEEFHLQDLKERKRQEIRERNQEREARELEEKRRLEIETENFKKRIHKKRMDELRKCYEHISTDLNLNKSIDDLKWESNDKCPIAKLKKSVPKKNIYMMADPLN